jgi:hypothetical protein
MATATTKMRRLGKWTDAFIADWREAAEAGLTRKQLAELMGLRYATLNYRAQILARRGVVLPPLVHGMAGNKNAVGNRGGRPSHKARRRKAMAARPSHAAPQKQAPLHFTILVTP